VQVLPHRVLDRAQSEGASRVAVHTQASDELGDIGKVFGLKFLLTLEEQTQYMYLSNYIIYYKVWRISLRNLKKYSFHTRGDLVMCLHEKRHNADRLLQVYVGPPQVNRHANHMQVPP
jgi:hypothetical protein